MTHWWERTEPLLGGAGRCCQRQRRAGDGLCPQRAETHALPNLRSALSPRDQPEKDKCSQMWAPLSPRDVREYTWGMLCSAELRLSLFPLSSQVSSQSINYLSIQGVERGRGEEIKASRTAPDSVKLGRGNKEIPVNPLGLCLHPNRQQSKS